MWRQVPAPSGQPGALRRQSPGSSPQRSAQHGIIRQSRIPAARGWMPHAFQEAPRLRQTGGLACKLPEACSYTACCLHRSVEANVQK